MFWAAPAFRGNWRRKASAQHNHHTKAGFYRPYHTQAHVSVGNLTDPHNIVYSNLKIFIE
jgi:hypothetical protein